MSENLFPIAKLFTVKNAFLTETLVQLYMEKNDLVKLSHKRKSAYLLKTLCHLSLLFVLKS